MNQIQYNPSFLTRTPSIIYNENMDIGQPLLLSPSLRSHSIHHYKDKIQCNI